MADFASVLRVGIVALYQRYRMAKHPELDETEIDREHGGRDHQPADDPGEGRPREVREDERDKPARRRGEGRVDCLIQSLRLCRARKKSRRGGARKGARFKSSFHLIFPVCVKARWCRAPVPSERAIQRPNRRCARQALNARSARSRSDPRRVRWRSRTAFPQHGHSG